MPAVSQDQFVSCVDPPDPVGVYPVYVRITHKPRAGKPPSSLTAWVGPKVRHDGGSAAVQSSGQKVKVGCGIDCPLSPNSIIYTTVRDPWRTPAKLAAQALDRKADNPVQKERTAVMKTSGCFRLLFSSPL